MFATFDELSESLIRTTDSASGGGDNVVDDGSPGVDFGRVVEDSQDHFFASHLSGLPPDGLEGGGAELVRLLGGGKIPSGA